MNSDIKDDVLNAAIESTFRCWVSGGSNETTLAVTLKKDGQIEIHLSGDRAVFPLLMSDLIQYAGKSMRSTTPGEFLYLINTFLELRGIKPEDRAKREDGLTIKFKEEGDE